MIRNIFYDIFCRAHKTATLTPNQYTVPCPNFGRLDNPISTRGDRLCPPRYYSSWIFRRSYRPYIHDIQLILISITGHRCVLLSNLNKVPFLCTKGEIISECPYEKIIYPKIATKKYLRFLSWPLRRGQIKKIKALYYTN